MSGIIQSSLLVILNVECIVGNLGNGFIVLVNCMDCVRRKKVSPVDQILTALAVSRFVLLCMTLIDLWVTELNPALWINKNILQIFYITWAVTNHFGTWLATCLSIFYFLKIANYSNSIFLYLKWNVTRVVSATGLMSLLLLLIEILLISINNKDWMHEHKQSMFYSSSSSNFTELLRLYFLTNTMFKFIPFAVSLATFLLLIVSLWKHLKRMQHNISGSRDASTMAHIKTLETMIISLLLYISLYLTFLFRVYNFKNQTASSVLDAVMIALLLGHSFVLILGNSKLRQAFLSVLRWLKCWSKNVDSSTP